MGIFEQVVATLIAAAILGLFGWWWRQRWKRPQASVQASRVPEETATAFASVAAPGLAADVVRRLTHILDPLGDHLQGLGSVMLRFGPPADRERRYTAIEELLDDFDRLKDRLYELEDDQLVEAIWKEFREIRHDILPRAKAAIERSSGQSEHGQHFGGTAMWSKVFAVEGGSLESRGTYLKSMARRVRDLPGGTVGSDQASEGEWTPKQLKKDHGRLFSCHQEETWAGSANQPRPRPP